MRSDPNVIRPEPSVKPPHSLLPDHLHRGAHHPDSPTVDDVASLLHTGLDKVERQGEEGGEEPCDGGRGEGLLGGR